MWTAQQVALALWGQLGHLLLIKAKSINPDRNRPEVKGMGLVVRQTQIHIDLVIPLVHGAASISISSRLFKCGVRSELAT